ncbi:MAG: UDP-N-acetylmuramoyl-tripeptide--D-alanyl-D-alanine ligase, partial [Symbiobacteriaceae bacterium]|nr:UDP-N-acetylmuramoyl-tripeptide--D-alanyl-D-alanine ligase [Symbiobacteriaceae bacterium]
MLNLTLGEMAAIVSGNLIGDPSVVIRLGVSDSREVQPGDLFVAISGERTDGHQYAAAALAAGAAAVLVERVLPDISPQLVVVDCRQALAQLARYQLQRYPVPVIAVTGSMGKTSCKDLTAAVLSARFHVLKNEGNRNTEISLPLTLFALTPQTEVAVLEMAMVAPGEIAELCAIAPPDYALICNILEVHLERLGSLEAIAAAKKELFDALTS